MKVEVRATGLRAQREKMNWTQRELAKRLDVTQNYIPAMELGNRNPSADLRLKMMKLFKCDFEDLFTVVMVNPSTKREDVLIRETKTA
ncbi:MAG TPA: helix-turn-helix transcriptional regulator [Candidatus Solibacter sp.]|nr:helix-turn-helix transcriptional regulator [Candidatus Solibacter sp.]